MGTDGNSLGGGDRAETDRISGLPDDLLHDILLRLPRRVAELTAVLSRRWRHVLAHVPVLYLENLCPVLPASCITIVDGALEACIFPALLHLYIIVDDRNLPWEGIMATHVAPWLRFASKRVAGELFLWLPPDPRGHADQDLDLPVCAGTRSIRIRLRRNFRLRSPPSAGGGAFAALTCLAIYNGRMDGRELGALVSSSMCPFLEELILMMRLAVAADVDIRSDSLKRLDFHVENTRRLVVVAPLLHKLCASKAAEAHIAAPNLAEVEHTDDMNRYELAEAGRHLQRLVINLQLLTMPVTMRRFDSIGELIVRSLSVPGGSVGYQTFMMDWSSTPKLNCEIVVLRSVWTCHGFAPSMLHLLRRCTGLKKFAVTLSNVGSCRLPSDCPCTWPESCRIDNFTLDSLEEIEINGFIGGDLQVKCVNVLLSCNAPRLKEVVFNLSSCSFLRCTNIIRDKILSVHLRPDTKSWDCLIQQNSVNWNPGGIEPLRMKLLRNS